MTVLPGSFGIDQLKGLDIKWCKALTVLPDSFGNSTSLKELDLVWCTAWQSCQIPSAIEPA